MFITNVTSRSTTDSFSPPPPGGGDAPISLNFHNHCLLCLQHVDPTVLKAIIQDNPKGLENFQPILQFLTGTVNPACNNSNNGSSGNQKFKYYPVTSNLPPLCTLCYDILAELYKFYGELMELQRKIQNQTEAARRIVKGTTRRGGMRGEFFHRLNIAGLPKKEIELMQYFIKNFHGLIMDTDGKTVLPQLLSLNFNDANQSASSIKLSSSSSLQPYNVRFAEPSMPSSQSAYSHQQSPFNNMEAITITSTSSLQPPHQVYSNTAFLVRIPAAVETNNSYLNISSDSDPIQLHEDDDVQVLGEDNQTNENLVDDVPTADEIYVVRGEHDPLSFEYEGDEDEEAAGAYVNSNEDEDDEERIAREIMLEKRTNMILEQLEMRDEEGEEEEETLVDGAEDNAVLENDVNYWKSALSSQVIMEAVVEEDVVDDEHVDEGEADADFEIVEVPVKKKIVEVIDLDDEEDEEEEQQNFASSSNSVQLSSNKHVFRCATCGKGYRSNQRLRYHEQTHLAGGRPKPWKCPYCNRGFSVKKLLEQHERIHTGERPFICNVCGDSFRQSSTLYRHRIVHSVHSNSRRTRSLKR